MNGDVELHCHLDGSVRPGTIERLAKEQGIELTGPIAELATVGPSCSGLVEYIEKIDVALDVLQTPEALAVAAEELVEDWHADGIVHGEVRFAPELHARRGLTFADITDAVEAGLAAGRARTGVATRLILCVLRPSSAATGWRVVEHAATTDAVAGVDVSGPEAGFSLLPHADAFRAARAAGLGVTVHAGEADGPRSVWDALDGLGATRIGHGVRSVQDPALVRRLSADGIVVETAPTSNVQTKAVPTFAAHPLNSLRDAGVRVTVNSDARTVSGTNLRNERRIVEENFGWGDADWTRARDHAWAGRF